MRGSQRQGHSLAELITVMAIILIMAAILAPHLFKALGLAHKAADTSSGRYVHH